MSTCVAVGCSNSSKKCKMYLLPGGKNDQVRRRIWIAKISRKDLPNHVRLCEEHFEPSQFEPLVPRKLKRDAIPTIFPHHSLPYKKPPAKRKVDDAKSLSQTVTSEHTYSTFNGMADDGEVVQLDRTGVETSRTAPTFIILQRPVMQSSEKCHILIGCTGSVASIKLPELLKQLLKQAIDGRHMEIKVIATENALHFIPKDHMPTNVTVYTDQDEWNMWKEMSDPVLHIELRKWADAMVIAPLDANTLAKIANGLCDNLLTCTVRAWDRLKPLFFCPAMNTYMWDHPVTAPQVKKLKELGYTEVPCVAKRLACGEVGYGGMAEVSTIVREIVSRMF